ncbi:MAG: membrane-bound lytic murein transglycosylase MltF [Deltaproteobacteria bacterium]|nr:MAG: membrane-bound lytic murein transglycosylase MltF [Deltaproteobacteria bacterium]
MLLLSIVSLLALSGSVEAKEDSLQKIRKAKEITVITRSNAHCYYIYREQPMGFEYDLAKAFADHLGVRLKVKIFPWADMIKALNEGRGDFIAASKTVTSSRKELIDFSDGYLTVQQRVIVRENNHTIEDVADLSGKTVHVRKATSYEERLSELRQQGLDLTIKVHDDVPTEELIRQVADKEIEVTIADSNIARLNLRYYPTVRIGVPIAETQRLGWAVKKGQRSLLKAINGFFKKIKSDGTFDDIYRDYFSDEQVFDRFDLKKFHQRIKTRLPKYQPIIKEAATMHGFDWRLIAAVTYQESHFNPRAKSHRGVRGLMQLTQATAREMGVTNRLDPYQSIMGGVKYLKRLYKRHEKAEDPDRMFIALASYNVGPRHILSAQRIARKRGFDPNRWSSLEQTLPLLCYEEYIRQSKHGYCRGTEPVRYINRIRTYYDILRRQTL